MIAFEVILGAIGAVGSVTTAVIEKLKEHKAAKPVTNFTVGEKVIVTVKRGDTVKFERVMNPDEASRVLAVAHEADKTGSQPTL
jgi:hypothetical protein